jgi:hypothetical protein
VGRQAATSDFLVGMEDLFAERLEQHDFSLSFRRDQVSVCRIQFNSKDGDARAIRGASRVWVRLRLVRQTRRL